MRINMLEMMYDSQKKEISCWNGKDIVLVDMKNNKGNCNQCSKNCFFWEHLDPEKKDDKISMRFDMIR